MAIPKIRLELSRKLRQLRKKRGWSQEQAAERTGMDVRYYQRIESTKPNAVKIDTLDRLAKAFKVSCSDLLDF